MLRREGRSGYLPQNLGYYPGFTVVQFVEYFALLKATVRVTRRSNAAKRRAGRGAVMIATGAVRRPTARRRPGRPGRLVRLEMRRNAMVWILPLVARRSSSTPIARPSATGPFWFVRASAIPNKVLATVIADRPLGRVGARFALSSPRRRGYAGYPKRAQAATPPVPGSAYGPNGPANASAVMAGAARFAALPAGVQHAWLVAHLVALRAGQVPLAPVP